MSPKSGKGDQNIEVYFWLSTIPISRKMPCPLTRSTIHRLHPYVPWLAPQFGCKIWISRLTCFRRSLAHLLGGSVIQYPMIVGEEYLQDLQGGIAT